MLKPLFFVGFFLFLTGLSVGQEDTLGLIQVNSIAGIELDTLEAQELVDPGIYLNRSHEKYLTNAGQLTYDYYWNSGSQQFNSLYGKQRNVERMLYADKPVSEINYRTGSSRDEYLSVYHGQRIARNFQLYTKYEKHSSQAIVLNNNGKSSDFFVRLRDLGKERYSFKVDFNRSHIQTELSGGLKNTFFGDTLFVDSIAKANKNYSKLSLDVNLNVASVRLKTRTFRTEQRYALLDKKNSFNMGFEQSTFIGILDRTYEDTDAEFYDTSYVSGSSRDTSKYVDFGLQGGFFVEPVKGVYLAGGIGRQLNHYAIGDTVELNEQDFVYAKGRLNLFSGFVAVLSTREYISGDWQGNYDRYFRLQYRSKLFKASFGSNMRKQWAPIEYRVVHSNRYRWAQEWKEIEETKFEANVGLGQEKWNVSFFGALSSQENALYMDSLFRPQQLSQTLDLVRGGLKLDFEHKLVHGRFQGAYQESSIQAFPVPKWTVFADFGLHFKAFKKLMPVRTGAELFYFSDFRAQSFMPALGMFYNANTYMVGDYPYLNFYLRGRVKSIELSFRVDHFNEGMVRKAYYAIPGYIATPRTFKVGLSWFFIH